MPKPEQRQADPRPRPGRAAPAGESVYHDFSKFNRPNMMSIKGDKNFNTSICSGGASKPRNLTLGVEPWSWCQKMCQVSICFIRCTFFIALSEICPQQPQPFFISWRRRRTRLAAALFFNCSIFFTFQRGPRFPPSPGPGCSFCFCLAPVRRFCSLVKPPVCFVISSSHPRPRPNVCAVSSNTRDPALFSPPCGNRLSPILVI